MGEILLQNTLTNRKEALQPLHPGEVRMYTCGPTVYDFAHIGNFRTFVFQDVLRRFLLSRGYRLNHVMNLTDVDDRIIQNAAAAGVSIREYTEKYVNAFLEDMAALNIEKPERIVRATDHIPEMVELDSEIAGQDLHLRQRRLDLLSHFEISGVRQAFENRYERDSGWGARGCGPV